MKTPPFLIAATLIFWGWQTHLWYAALPMAVVLESARMVKTRWDFSLADFIRISDLSVIALVGIAVYTLYADAGKAVMVTIQWLPTALFPLLTAQSFSMAGQVDIRALLLLARKKENPVGKPYRAIDLSYPYVVLCLVSAASANMRDGSFYICLLLLAAWALWPLRSKRFSVLVWIALLLAVGAVGYAGHVGLHRLQRYITHLTARYLLDSRDPYRSITSIGDIEPLKLSDRILFRVDLPHSPARTLLLREASYDNYHSGTWFAGRSGFSKLSASGDGTVWALGPTGDKREELTVSIPIKRGTSLLKLPQGAFQIKNLAAQKVEKNPLGAVRVETTKSVLTYQATFDPGQTWDRPPRTNDLQIPKNEQPAVSRIVKELDLASKSPHEISDAIKALFQGLYQYSLDLEPTGAHATALADFLIQTRKGHCEYFATATVLILRAGGIPARYASGYAVMEYSALEKQFVVRSRHAHAWALAYIDGVWQDLDTTPASWEAIEAAKTSKLRVFSDLKAFLLYKLSRWWSDIEKDKLKEYTLWLLLPLVIILARRLFHVHKKIKPAAATSGPAARKTFIQGADSDFYLLEKRLNELGYQRHTGETFPGWLARIEKAAPLFKADDQLAVALALHYQNRFGPAILSPADKALLGKTVASLMASIAK